MSVYCKQSLIMAFWNPVKSFLTARKLSLQSQFRIIMRHHILQCVNFNPTILLEVTTLCLNIVKVSHIYFNTNVTHSN